jgi:hypothetical protein
MVFSPSDWLAIALIGVGAVVSTFAKRTIRVVGIVVLVIGLVGFVFARMYLDVSPQASSNSAGNINGNSGIVTQGQSGNNSIGK